MTTPLLIVASEFWEKEDVNEFVEIFDSSYHIHTKKVERLSLDGGDPILWLAFTFGGGVLSGFGQAIGQEIWEQFKKKFVKRVEEKPSSLRVVVDAKEQKAELNLFSTNPDVVKRALDSVDETVSTMMQKEKNIYLTYDEQEGRWKGVEERKFVKTFTGIMGSKNRIVKNGVTIQLTDKDLQQIAEKAAGTVINLNHTNVIIGKVIRGWVDGDFVKFEAGIFEGLPKDVMESIEQAGGVSMEFFHGPEEEQKKEQ